MLEAPEAVAGGAAERFGVALEREPDGRYFVADLAPLGLAETAGLDFGDYVTGVDVAQPGRPAKELVYPIGLLVVLLVIGLQWPRRRRAGAPAA